MQLRVQITGMEQVLRRLDDLQKKVRTKILRDATRAGAKVVSRAMKAAAPVSTDERLVPGLLKLAIAVKVKVYRSGIVVAIVGPRTKFARDKKTRQRKLTTFGKMAGRRVLKKGLAHSPLAQKQSPSSYAHLAGPGRHQQFATEASRSAAAEARSAMIDTILDGIAEATH